MLLKWLKRLSEIGIVDGLEYVDKRSIAVSNNVSTALILISILFLISNPLNYGITVSYNTIITIGVLCVPYALNYLRNYTLAKFFISWTPPLLFLLQMVSFMKTLEVIPDSLFTGSRFFIVAFGCIPYFLFRINPPYKLIISVIPYLLVLMFMDEIFEFFDVSMTHPASADIAYHSVSKLAVFSYLFVSGICISLKYIIQSGDKYNLKLISELEVKNKVIADQAKKDLAIVNQKLQKSLTEVKNREYMLNESQRVANIGSWELNKEGVFTFWSDEMYDIFGLNPDLPANEINLKELVGNENSLKLQKINELLISNPYEKSYETTVLIETSFGYKKWVSFISSAFLEEDGVYGFRGICHDVTKAKESELLLKSSNQKYKNLFEQAYYSILLINSEGIILDANQSFCDLIESKRSLILLKKTSELIEFIDPFIVELKKLNTNEIYELQGIVETQSGEEKIVEVNIKGHGENLHMVVIRDVTKLRLAEEQLRQSESLFRTSFESSALGMAMFDLEGNYFDVNVKFSEITGYTKAEVLQLNFIDIIFKEDRGFDLENFESSLEGNKDYYKVEKRLIHKTGAIVWVNVTVSLIKTEDDKPLHFVSQVEDITDRKYAELELIEAETKFRTLVEKSMVGVYIVKDGKFVYVNQAFATILGYSTEELTEINYIDSIVHPDSKTEVIQNMASRLEGEVDSMRYEIKGIHKNGSIVWVEVFGSKIVYQGSDSIIGTLIDITDRKLHESEQQLFKSVVGSIDEAIISISSRGVINSWNRGAYRIFGIKRKDANSNHLSKIFNEFDLDIDQLVKTTLNEDQAIENIEKPIHVNGENKIITLSIYPLEVGDVDEKGAVVIARDITFSVQAQRALIESELKYRTLVEQAPEALVMYDLEKKVFVEVSKSAEEMFVYSREELLTMSPVDLSSNFQATSDDSNSKLLSYYENAYEIGRQSFNWVFVDSKGKEIPCEVILVKLPSQDRRLVRGSIIDISERIRREQQLAEANKKIGELKLTALRSVMSPHFIFNVLNSIQYFIGKNDRLNAINYLSTFSKLIRSILTHSVDNKISLSDEIQMLKNYVNLEMLRFENQFDFEFVIDSKLDTDSIEIPSLLIQPYVENAILHGLYNKIDKGKLIIAVEEKGDVLYFTIEDNGIGREAAKALKSKNFPKHQSMGLKLTEERLRLINENKNISFYLEDLKDNDGNALGTRVVIGILV
ncbi:PAS domain S-box protein [Marinigracilibium pacificum]|uniref:histidine kinase n=1 Tax=Marinigracilibium pacificum TaxID=2729599 RepID=A0A848ISY1_9BACT|nr:PAS domain S-box protein [Marinigracilibium pacificum]NMM47437.1 PAS domain S-box protein [Marinigracilibium pacificum]